MCGVLSSRQRRQRESPSLLCVHEHPRGPGGLLSAAGRGALGARQEGGRHRPLPSDDAHGPRDLHRP